MKMSESSRAVDKKLQDNNNEFQKYKCIRCMHDDRISDGELVQIDQCMNCTRYEPVYGKLIILIFYTKMLQFISIVKRKNLK